MAENTSVPEAPTPVPTPTPPAEPAAPAPVSPTPTNGLAVAALVTGIVAVITGWVPFWGLLVGVAAVVLGILGLKKATGKGMAIAGLVTGAVGALWGLLVSVLFVIALVISANAANTIQQSVNERNDENQALIDAKKDFAKGETATFGDSFEVKANSIKTNYDPGSYYKPGDGNQYIVLNVTVKNISDESQYVSAYTFSLIDNGISKAASYITVADKLDTGTLEPGASITGNLLYEVNKDASGLKLKYETTVYDASYKSKKLTYTLAL